MAKRSTWTCPKCGENNSKRYILCNKCNSVNERKINSILDLERSAAQNPKDAKVCKCGTLLPDEVKTCPYCGASGADNFHKLDVSKKIASFETPSTRHLHLKSHKVIQQSTIKRDGRIERPGSPLTACSACGHQISIKAESCPSCGNPTGVHVCPNCQSINTKVISGASKAGSIFLWGVFAANKVVSKFECKDCGHKW